MQTKCKLQLSFKSKYEFLCKIAALLTGPPFMCASMKIVGDIRGKSGALLEKMVEI